MLPALEIGRLGAAEWSNVNISANVGEKIFFLNLYSKMFCHSHTMVVSASGSHVSKQYMQLQRSQVSIRSQSNTVFVRQN